MKTCNGPMNENCVRKCSGWLSEIPALRYRDPGLKRAASIVMYKEELKFHPKFPSRVVFTVQKANNMLTTLCV